MKKACLLSGLVCIAVLGFVNQAVAQYTVKVSSLDLRKMNQENWSPQRDQSITGQPLKIGEIQYNDGIGTHANSVLHINLKRGAERFTAFVGVDNNPIDPSGRIESQPFADGTKLFYAAGNSEQENRFVGIGRALDQIKPGSVVFKVMGDGKLLWKSRTLKKGDSPQEIKLDVRKLQTLSLVVEDGQDGISGDCANWGAAELLVSGNRPEAISNPKDAYKPRIVLLSSLDLTQCKTGWGTVNKNKSAGGSPISIAERKFTNGVGVHAESAIYVDLQGYGQKFEAYVGVDDGVKDRLGVDSGTVVFKVVGDGKLLWESQLMKYGDPAKKVEVDLRNIQGISLLVGNYDGSVSCDHANWADAKLTVSGPDPKILQNEPPLPLSEEKIKLYNTNIKAKINQLPSLSADAFSSPEKDWMIDADGFVADIYQGNHPDEIILANGLLKRVFRLAPNAATVSFDNLVSGEVMLRGVKPEATLRLNGKDYNVGGLKGQVEYGFLKYDWLDSMIAHPQSFQLVGMNTGEIVPRCNWKRVRRASSDAVWPPKGKQLELVFAAPNEQSPGMTLSVHYAIYDGIPLISKWVTINNKSDQTVHLETITTEILAVVEAEVAVNDTINATIRLPNMHVESDFSMRGSYQKSANRAIHWVKDPQYSTQIVWVRSGPYMLESRIPMGPDVMIKPGQVFESHRTWELLHDTTDRERQSLAVRRMYRVISPWVTENPSVMHVRSSNKEAVFKAVDQCAEVGIDMVILTFGSGANIEDMSDGNISYLKLLADYAHKKGVEIGGYSLLASSRRGEAIEAINPKTGKPGGMSFGYAPCLCTDWGNTYFANLKRFFVESGFNLLEHDGSYPGDVCASTQHSGHRGLNDSHWLQWCKIRDFYRWCLANNIYMNVPDWYYLSGAHKCAMHYRESNFSLPRERQLLLARQNIYDSLWGKTPSMGWMAAPLVQYHGGGAAATFEPLEDNLNDYELCLAQNFGMGVQAHWRGHRLYDTEKTKSVVKKWTGFYEKYWEILNSDIIHITRPNGRTVDCMMHVNPQLEEKGLVMLFNPLEESVETELELPLYYTGLADIARVTDENNLTREYRLDREYRIKVAVEIRPQSAAWLVIR